VNEEDVRGRAEAAGEALVAGDVDRVVGFLSDELRRNLGEVVALLPLPASEVNVESIERTASGYAVVFELTGASDQTRIQTRWKDRDGEPTIVEVSHLSRAELVPSGLPEAGEGAEGTEAAEAVSSGE
jgi:hypothetical protein